MVNHERLRASRVLTQDELGPWMVYTNEIAQISNCYSSFLIQPFSMRFSLDNPLLYFFTSKIIRQNPLLLHSVAKSAQIGHFQGLN
jgi:hypothetical protein